MYVQWLLEFVWRIFIQGPLLVINFFTSDKNIYNIFSNTSFFNGTNSIINISIVLSILIAISAVFIVITFIYKLFKILILSNGGEYTKIQIVETMKEFAKVIFFIFLFVLFFGTLFFLFDVLFMALNDASEQIITSNGESNNISNIPSILYYLITGIPNSANNSNFLFPDSNYLETANSMNFLISIIFVVSFSLFLIWNIWSIFQKMLEIMFLFVTFPISLGLGLESQKINWRVWTKEILNKMLLIFILAISLRLFLWLFFAIYANIVSTLWAIDNGQLYISFFVSVALGGAMIFATKMFSYKLKENIGFIGSFSSTKQTRSFITNNNLLNKVETLNKLAPINENVLSLKSDIARVLSNSSSLRDIEKVKVFNK